MNSLKIYISILILLFAFKQISAQLNTNKIVGIKNTGITEDLISKGCPYSLPIGGAAATDNWSETMTFSTKADFDATGLGFGLTPTTGVGGGWLALDMNMLWTDVGAHDKPVFAYIIGPRIGKSFQFNNPESNITFWAGSSRLNISSPTNDSIKLSEVLPANNLQSMVDDGIVRVDEASAEVEARRNSLTPPEQKNLYNIAKYETVNRALESTGNMLAALHGELNNEQNATVQYSPDKKLKK